MSAAAIESGAMAAPVGSCDPRTTASPRRRSGPRARTPSAGGDPPEGQLHLGADVQAGVAAEVPPPQQAADETGSPRPQSFGRWFAHQARTTDIVWLLADAVFTNVSHAARLEQGLYCDGSGSGGDSGGASQQEPGPAACSSTTSSGFPCGGGLASKLLWSLRTGAVIDPVLRLRMWDYGNLFYTWGELAAVLVALLAPGLYVRCRPLLIGAISAAPIVGGWLTLLLAPDAALRLSAVAYMAARRHRVGGVYLGWRSAALLRVPTSAQLVTGPVLWLLAASALSIIDRRMPPPGSTGSGSEEGRRAAVHALLLFAAIVVLPYLIARAWEDRALRPEYGKYLRDLCTRAGRLDSACGDSEADPDSDEADGAAEAGGSSQQRAVVAVGPDGGSSGNDDAGGSSCSSEVCSPTWVSTRSPGGGAASSSITSDAGNSGAGYQLMLRSGSVEAYRCGGEDAASGLLPAIYGEAGAMPAGWPVPVAVTSLPQGADRGCLAGAEGCSSTGSGGGCDDVQQHATATAVVQMTATSPTASSTASACRTPTSDVRIRGAASRRFAAAIELQQDAAVANLAAAGRPGSVIYRSAAALAATQDGIGYSRSRSALVSIKVPVRHRASDPAGACSFGAAGASGHAVPSFEEASAFVLQTTAAALEAYNRAAVELWPTEPASRASSSSGSSVSVSGSGSEVDGLRGAVMRSPRAAAGPPPLRCLSAVCVEGCVQLLMVLHFMAAAEEHGLEGREGQPPPAAGSYPPMIHVDLQPQPQPMGQAMTAPAPAARGPKDATGQAADGATELGGGTAVAVQAAAISAVQQVLAQAGAAGPDAVEGITPQPAGSTSALCWPAALALLPAASTAGEAGASSGAPAEKDEGAVTILFQLPARAAARGLRSVRCVLAGPAAVEPAGGEAPGSGGEAAVVHVDSDLPLHFIRELPDEGGGSAPDLAYVRLPIPVTARQAVPGLRMLHLLRPLERGAAAAPASPSATDAVRGRSNPSGDENGPESTAPLAAVPLLVMGREAAAELQQLHEQVLGPEAVAQLQQLGAEAGSCCCCRAAAALAGAAAALPHSGLTSLVLDLGALMQLPAVDGDGPGSGGLEGGGAEPVAAFGDLLRYLVAQRMAGCLHEGLAALQHAGMQLLLPGEEEEDMDGTTATATGPDSARCNQRLQAAVDFLLPAAALAPRSESAAVPQQPRSPSAPAATVHCLLQHEPATAEPEQGLPGAPAAAPDPPSAATGAAALSVAGAPDCGLPARPASPATAAASQSAFAPAATGGPAVPTDDEDISRASYGSISCSEELSRLGSLASSAAMPAAVRRGGALPARVAWWLRALAFGFPRTTLTPASHTAGSSSEQTARAHQQPQPEPAQGMEAAYQAYKAASCRPLDCMSLVVHAAFRVVSLVRTCASAGAAAPPPPPSAAVCAAAAGAVGAAAAPARRVSLLWAFWRALRAVSAVQQPPADEVGPLLPTDDPAGLCAAAGSGSGGGCLRPYLDGRLTDTQLQVLAQLIFLGTCLTAIALMVFTRLHSRRRNAFLLLRAGLDAAGLALITLPLPRWPAPLLGVPQCWLDNNRRTGVHWLVFGLYEPLTLQLSPPLQALQALIFIVPLTLMNYYTFDCRWRPALRFGLGHAVLALAVSAATDARSRMLFMRRARGGAAGRA